MRFRAALAALIVTLGAAAFAQNASPNASKDAPQPESVTIPFALDQGRVVIDVDLTLQDGSAQRVRAWVDNGNPNLHLNQRIAGLMGISLNCDGQVCSGKPVAAPEVAIGGMKIRLEGVKDTKISLAAAIGPGMSAEINIPSTVLRNYDVLINYPDRELTVGLPGHIKFNGVKSKMMVSTDGLIHVPGKIENKNYDLALDLGSSVNFLAEELFNKLSTANPDWPHMIGAVGPFNTGERGDEAKWKLMRIDRVQYGPLFLTDVAVANIPAATPADTRADASADTSKDISGDKNKMSAFAERPSFRSAGAFSSEALLNYRVGLDHAHSTIYFDIARTVKFPDFDVVGLILRPEGDTGFTIAGVADFDSKPSVVGVQAGDHLLAVDDTPIAELTLGQVWSLLEGSPGKTRKLTVAHAGNQFTVVAQVQRFLEEAPASDDAMGKAKKKKK
ncbi:MAG: hypothetical protein WA718_07085 [Terriglobales bacterium]